MYASSRFALSFVLVPSCYECYPVYLSLFFFYLSLYYYCTHWFVRRRGQQGAVLKDKTASLCAPLLFRISHVKEMYKLQNLPNELNYRPNKRYITTNKQTTRLHETILVCFVLVCGFCRVRAKRIGRKRKGT